MFSKGLRVHLVGIKGVGMTALAQVLKARGVKLSGSDTKEKFFTDRVLSKAKIPVELFSAKNITKDIELVISSGAYFFQGKVQANNPEVKEALKKKITILSYPQAIGELAKDYKMIAVSGSHGKSTTTAMLGWLLEQTGKDPNVIVGTKVRKWESNARVGKSPWLIFEADEYREAFLNLKPQGLIITSIDYDHPDYFKTKASYYRAFRRLISRVQQSGFVIGCGDDLQVRAALKFAQGRKLKTQSYGFLKSNTLSLSDEGVFAEKQMFHALFHKKKFKGKLLFSGKYSILNSGAAFLAASMLKVSPRRSLAALASFPGTARRFELVKSYKNQSKLIDDYAHHPSEIRAVLQGAKALYPKHRLVAVFQPHMFSRTKVLLKDFARSFSQADEVVIMEIYPSAREKKEEFKVSSQDLLLALKKQHPRVSLQKNRSAAKKKVNKELHKPHSVVLLLGAGDLNYLI